MAFGELFREYKREIGAATAAAGAIAALVYLYPEHDTSGKGNHFELRGYVVAVGERSVTIDDITIETAEGRATGWFNPDDHQVHDNFQDGCGNIKTVGSEANASGLPMHLGDVVVGDMVDLTGEIRDSKVGGCSKGSYWTERPVFDHLVDESRP